MLATRHQDRQGLQELDNLLLLSHLHTEDSGTLQDKRCKSTIHNHHPSHNLSKSQLPVSDSDIEEMRHIPYMEAVGSLMYAVIGTQPDIAYTISYLARFMANPGHVHWEAVKRVIRYLKGTKDVKLVLRKGGTLTWEEAKRQS